MTDDRRAEEASRLADELRAARDWLAILRDPGTGPYTSRRLIEYQESVVRTLERRLDQAAARYPGARYVGD